MDSSYDDLHFIVKNSSETFSVIFKHCVNRLVMYWKASPPVRVIIIYCSTLFSSTEEANKSRNLFYGQKRKSFWNSYLTHSALHTHTKLSVGPFVKAGWKKNLPWIPFFIYFAKSYLAKFSGLLYHLQIYI